MHGLTLLSVVLLALSTLATADSHLHRVNHRGVHRRHHVRAEASAGKPRRRSCPASSASAASDVPASSTVSVAVPSTTAASTGASASSSAAPSATPSASDDTPASTASPAAHSSSKASSAHASSTASSAAPAATGADAAADDASKSTAAVQIASLFPVTNAIASWSTASTGANAKSAKSIALELSDATLRPTRVLSGTTHTYMDFAGKRAMRAHYPKGSYNFQHSPRGGFSWYAYGPTAVDLTTAREATLAYSVYFPTGFNFVLGGKLPGLYGGNTDDGSISCSGGSRDDECFSTRQMWRTGGKGELYTYLPPSYPANDRVCNVPPLSDCNPTYGASVGRGAYSYPTGRWVTVAQRVRLNDAGKQNGEVEVFADGQSVIKVTGLVLRNSDAGRIRGIIGQTFFGGSKPEWATPKDQDVYFADFSVAITAKL